MADLTEEQIQEAITNIHTTMQSMVTTPKPSYKVGEHEYKWNEYHKILIESLRYYKELASELPAEEATIWRKW
jgi:hypothetical protein